MNPYARSALAGAATGCRTFTGVAALALATPAGEEAQPDHALANPWVRGLIALAAVQELVMDKLPITPSRLEPLGLAGRIAAAAGAGVIVSRRHRAATTSADPSTLAGPTPLESAPTPLESARHAVVAVAACIGSAVLGERWRDWAVPDLGSDYVAAGIEDAVAISMAAVAAL